MLRRMSSNESGRVGLALAVALVALQLLVPPSVFACTPPAPESVALLDCCQRGANTYVGKHDFCYCSPEKIATVCQLGPGAASYPLLRVGGRCQMLKSHPLWPGQSISCASPPSTSSAPSASSHSTPSAPSTPTPPSANWSPSSAPTR